MEQGKINRLETTSLIGPMVDAHWEGLRQAKAQGRKVAWSFGPLFPLAYAMGIPTHFYAGYCSYVAGRKHQVQLLELAEADGHLLDTCCYHRVHMGMTAAMRKGVELREDIRLPMPDLLVTGRLCSEHSHLHESIYRQLKIPVISVDFPPPHNDSEIPERTRFIERQLSEYAIPELEKFCGRKFDYDRLSEILAVLKQTALLRNECWEMMKRVPSPCTLIDYAVSIAPVFYMMGMPGTIEYYTKLKNELQHRIKNGIGAISPKEKYRLYFDGWIPWPWIGLISRKVAAYGGNLLVGRYPWEFFPHPEMIDPSDPIHTLAQQQTYGQMIVKGMGEYAVKFVAEAIEEYSLDGLIMWNSRTCRLWAGMEDIVEEMERKYGVPGVIIEADIIDPKFFSEAQLDTRLQALFEMLDARRRVRTR